MFKVTEINVPMAASSASLDEVVITTTTKRESETAILLEQKKAATTQTKIGAVELSKKGVSDVATGLTKATGISKESDKLYVRGLGDRYLNTTLNGLSLPSNKIDNKNIDLNLFSSDVIKNVAISKTYSTNLYGDFAAGNVDVVSKDYSGKGFFNASVSTGFNTNAVGETFMKSDGTGHTGFYTRYEHNPFAVVLSHGFDPTDAAAPIDINFGGSFGKSFDFENIVLMLSGISYLKFLSISSSEIRFSKK